MGSKTSKEKAIAPRAGAEAIAEPAQAETAWGMINPEEKLPEKIQQKLEVIQQLMAYSPHSAPATVTHQ